MDSLTAELRHEAIISATMAVNIRKYIEAKNPQLSYVRRAGIFADAVNRIVDSRLPGFNADQIKKLKQLLFRDAARKSTFSIDCSDVFVSAVKLKTSGMDLIDPLCQWLSEAADIKVNKESLSEFLLNAHNLLEAEPDTSITELLTKWDIETGTLPHNSNAEIHADEPVSADINWKTESGSLSFNVTDEEKNNMEDTCTDTHEALGYPEFAVNKRAILSTIYDKFLLLRRPLKLVVSAVSCLVLLFIVAYSGVIFAGAGDNNKEVNIEAPYFTASDLMNLYPNREDADVIGAYGTESSGASIKMRATAYDLSMESCGKSPDHPLYGYTSSGARATVGRTVAVDPEVIPLGTRLLITFPPEYRELNGVYIAEDTGRLIKGDKIDIFFGEDKPGSRMVYKSAMRFGIRYVDVQILD